VNHCTERARLSLGGPVMHDARSAQWRLLAIAD
jgi:hypothetical protein